jgi:hypothetical protein
VGLMFDRAKKERTLLQLFPVLGQLESGVL